MAQQGLVPHTSNPSIWGAETRRLGVQGWSGINRKLLPEKIRTRTTTKTRQTTTQGHSRRDQKVYQMLMSPVDLFGSGPGSSGTHPARQEVSKDQQAPEDFRDTEPGRSDFMNPHLYCFVSSYDFIIPLDLSF